MSHPRTTRRIVRRAPAAASLLAALAVMAAACSPGPTPSPSTATSAPSSAAPSPSLAAVALPPDLAPLAPDGTISEADLYHDSRSDLYRAPGGAVPAGTKVALRIRAGAGDLTDASIRVTDTNAGASVLVPMKVVATDRTGGTNGYDYWEASLATPPQPDLYTYSFIVKDGPTTRYLEDQVPAQVYTDETNDGGTGQVYAESPGSPWQIAAYDPDFTTPDWSHGAVAYQIFPDRFFNAVPANDPSPTAVPGTSGAERYRQPTNYGEPVIQKAWTDLPEGYCRSWQGVTCTEQPQGRDYFGGDIAGITAKLDDLKALGVTVLYLNPVFAASSNHRYDTLDYRYIDPGLGTSEEFATFVAAAKERGIHVILDGVFNHVSSSSPYFDRLRQYSEVGACEAADSPYRGWFTFVKPDANQPSPCAPSAEGGDDTYYVGWGGYDTIPELVEGDSNVLFLGKDGAIAQWLGAGASGWRLDAMDKLSHGLVKGIRATTKEADPDSLIIGEVWGNTAPYLLGNEADTTMNYRFRSAVIGLVNGATTDYDGDIPEITPSQFADRMLNVQSQYPAAAWDSLMNLVGTHDTSRILWVLTPAEANGEAKTEPDALAQGKEKLRQIAAVQMTWPGMAAVYYGDEAGLTGADDPDDRRPYPWDAIDTELRDYYRTLGTLRGQHESLKTGDLHFLLTDDDAGTLAFGRRTDAEAAVTVLNLSDAEKTIDIPVADFLPEGATLDSALFGTTPVVSSGMLTVTLPARGVDVLITRPGTDLAGPAAPTGVTAAASPGGVALAWAPVDGAASYRVLRSILPGGYAEVGATTQPAFTDTTARPGDRVPLRGGGARCDGQRERPVRGRDGAPAADDRGAPCWTPRRRCRSRSRRWTPAQPIGVLVTVDGVTGAATPAIGLGVQVGFGATGSDPNGGTAGSGRTRHGRDRRGRCGPLRRGASAPRRPAPTTSSRASPRTAARRGPTPDAPGRRTCRATGSPSRRRPAPTRRRRPRRRTSSSRRSPTRR